jgi:hypothetical protein
MADTVAAPSIEAVLEGAVALEEGAAPQRDELSVEEELAEEIPAEAAVDDRADGGDVALEEEPQGDEEPVEEELVEEEPAEGEPAEAQAEPSALYAELRQQFAVGSRWRMDAAFSVLSTTGKLLGFSVTKAKKIGGHSQKERINCVRYVSTSLEFYTHSYFTDFPSTYIC